ncbi:hypothetical protein H6G97_36980 [Nostoc flagelliforme FACHB-838]|uniref:Transposase n=1 Tax=Nostoc flagelliforme FACHB-838 TaxID=2692904 RepID=A0ABR8E2C7_9NOSO|nr:hypothetical protein [Nostoc flagelliforme]MBD2534764.1 hypothetical protein [Nostoc flagelliforme FACHB-838]
MKTLQQSLKLRAVFQEKITAKKSAVHQEIHQACTTISGNVEKAIIGFGGSTPA